MNWCKWLGHKWHPVYIGKYSKWKMIGCFCKRCNYGYDDLINFLSFLQYNKGFDFGTYNEKYFIEADK